ncbi:phospholipid scramblase 2-like isoform X2 [Triplophysa rosa]|uniref:phospholipid scramblase 2-like isoform X2 n=1 Tax=Triplophysa rosa TaxID=992332 RepID=UPI002545CA5E|nr:phospholipid scramblase 2-like isoform X2 [Triplophysa rosa]
MSDRLPQNHLPHPLAQPGGQCVYAYGEPGLVTEVLPDNQPPIQPVVYTSAQMNLAPHQIQPYEDRLPQNHLPHPLAQPGGQCVYAYGEPGLVTEVLPDNQPPIQPVVYTSAQMNLAPHQIQPYEAPALPVMAVPVGVPPGLQYLTMIDQVLIHQKMECIEIFTGFETNNQYEIKNSLGQLIFQAKEKTDCCTRNILGAIRNFQIRIEDNMGQEVMRVQRPLRCDSCCCPCCLQELEIQAPPGVTIGHIKQNWHAFFPIFSVQGPHSETLLKIKGPFMACKCGDIHFEVKGKEGEKPIGRITKQRSGILQKCFTDATNFTVQFPMDMDVKTKAVLMGACFLIDFMFFEKGGGLFWKLL